MAAVASANIYLFQGFRLDRRAGVLSQQDQRGVFVPLAIGRRALDILAVLVEHSGDLVLRDEIMSAVWPRTVVEDGNLTVQISTLRRVLDNNLSEGSLIETVPGRGYRFVGEVTQPEPNSPPAAEALTPATALVEVADIRQAVSPGPRRKFPRAVVILVMALCLAGIGLMVFWNSDHRWFDKAAVPPRLSIVVLPFSNLGEDRAQQYFVDAITEDLTTDLSRMSDSFVISRSTAFTFKDKSVEAKQIGRELGVRYVLEGSVRRSGNQVRVNVQLIDAENNAHLWAERFDRDIVDLFDLEHEITNRIGNALTVRLIRIEAARPHGSPEAVDYVFQGRAAYAKGPARDSFAEAVGLFERALSLDPGSVLAQSHLANTLTTRVTENMTDTRAADIARAEALIGLVLATSPTDAVARVAKGRLLRVQGRCEEAIIEFQTVLAINRNHTGALMQIGRCRISLGLLDEAIPPMAEAIRLNPDGPFIGVWFSHLAFAHLLRSRIDEAVLWLEKSRSASPDRAIVHAWLAAAYGLNRDTGRAAAELAEARRLSADDRYSSIAHLRAAEPSWNGPKLRAKTEATYFAGLRLAGMPEE